MSDSTDTRDAKRKRGEGKAKDDTWDADDDEHEKLKGQHVALFCAMHADYSQPTAFATLFNNKDLQEFNFASSSLSKLNPAHDKAPAFVRQVLEVKFKNVGAELALQKGANPKPSLLNKWIAAFAVRAAVLHASPLPVAGSSTLKYYPAVPNMENGTEDLSPVVLRPEDEEFWMKCLDVSDERKVCGVGVPGIGKTTTTFYLIQKILMEKKKPVVYALQEEAKHKSRTVYTKFVPILSDDKAVDVFVSCVETDEEPQNALNWDDGDYYVVDPGRTKFSCDCDFVKKVHSILVASCDSRHWGDREFEKMRSRTGTSTLPDGKIDDSIEEIFHKVQTMGVGPDKKRRLGGGFVYCRSWTLCDIIACKDILGLSELSDESIALRYRLAGGSVRRILDFDQDKVQEKMRTSLSKVSAQTIQALADGRCWGAFDVTAPESSLVFVEPNKTDATHYQVSICSDFAEELIAEQHLKLSWFAVLNEENAGNRGNLFEAFIRQKLSKPIDLSMDRWSSHKPPPKKRKEKKKEKKKNCVESSFVISFPSRYLKRVTNLAESVRNSESDSNIMFYSKDESEELIDMICRFDGGFLAIQVTIQQKHTAKVEQIWKLLNALGPLPDGKKLIIVYAVPKNRLSEFETTPVNPLLDDPRLVKLVEIYHVGIDDDGN